MKITKKQLRNTIKEELRDILEAETAEVPKWAVKYLTAPAQEDGAGGIHSEMMKHVPNLAKLLNYDLEEKEPIGITNKTPGHEALDDLLKLVNDLGGWASGREYGYDFKDLSQIKNELAIVLTTINNLGDMRPDFRSAERALDFQVRRIDKVLKSKVERDRKKKPKSTGQEWPGDPHLTPSGRNLGYGESLDRIARKVEEQMVRRLRKT